MAWKTQVVDRVPTYAGRVKMTPVSGQTNVYDLERADSPITEGTPINAALLNTKADSLVESVTVYVSQTGSDITGTGANTAPFATIKAAVNALPKNLGGFHALIDIAEGTYDEQVILEGFTGGRLTLGVAGRAVTVSGVEVQSCIVRLNISNITHSAKSNETLLYADYGSNVTVLSPLTISGENAVVSGVGASRGSVINADDATVTVQNCGADAVFVNTGAKIAFGIINGDGNVAHGLRAEDGGVISYDSRNMVAAKDDASSGGGRIVTGSNVAQTNIPITSEVPEDSTMWIDPNESTFEDDHVANKNNPHGVTAEQVGAATTASYRTIISEDGWSNSVPYTQTIIVNGLLASDEPFVDVDFSIVESAGDALYILENWQNIGRLTVSADNTLTVYCYEEKAVCNIPILLKVVR